MGVEKSLEKGFQWFLRAAEGGDSDAISNVGICYSNGQGVEKDYAKSIHYFTLAAEQDEKTAQFNLAICFAKGEGVKQSDVKAIYWFRQCLKNNKDEEQCAEAKKALDECFSFQSTVCSSCDHRETKFPLKCSRCLSAYYCNINCQKKHWKNGHKEECKKP